MSPPRENKKYREWIRTLHCCVCGSFAPSTFAHQRILGNGGMGMKPPDLDGLPMCHDCHMVGEHGQGVISLWKTKRPELWVKKQEDADPLHGKLFNKQDLREWIGNLVLAYNQFWEKVCIK